MRVEESIEITRPLQEVFDYVSDVGNYPEWMAHALEVRKDTAGPPQQLQPADNALAHLKGHGSNYIPSILDVPKIQRCRAGVKVDKRDAPAAKGAKRRARS